MSDRIIVFGAGGHARVMIESLRASRPGIEITVLDDDPASAGRAVLDLAVAGTRSWLEANWPEAEVALALGRNALRADFVRWLASEGRTAATIVDPGARVSPSATIGAGSFLAPGAIVNAQAVLEGAVIVNTGASIDHDCRIGFAAHIAPGARLCGGVQVGEESLIGVGAAVVPGVRIGRGAVVGAGAAVTRDVPDGTRVGGVPARPLRG